MKKKMICLLTALLLLSSMLTVMVLPAAAIEPEDPYAKVTGTVNDDGYIVPDSNVMFIFASQPADASADGFSYQYPGNNKTYWLKWDTNAKIRTDAILLTKIKADSEAWATDSTGTVSRDSVFVFAPGDFNGSNLTGSGYPISTRAASGVKPTTEQVMNVYFLGAKAGVSPVSADRSTKEKAKAVAGGRSNVISNNESVFKTEFTFPSNCNFYMDGFSAKAKGTFSAANASVNVNVNIKNHYVTGLTAPARYTAVFRTFGSNRGLYEFENVYFDMKLSQAVGGDALEMVCNKLVFNNCVFANANNAYKSQTVCWLPQKISDAKTYQNFYGEYTTKPVFEIKNSIVADCKDDTLLSVTLGPRTDEYGDRDVNIRFDGNTIFDYGDIAADSAVFKLASTNGGYGNDFNISIQNNSFSFSDEVFGKGTTGNSYAISFGPFTAAALDGQGILKNNTFSVPADGKTLPYNGGYHDCTRWTIENNTCQTNDGAPIEVTELIDGHLWGEEVVLTPPTATQNGEAYCICSKCNNKKTYTLLAGEAEIGSTVYPTFTEALAAAKEGDAVVLRSNVESSVVTIYPGITIDLNGFNLTADYVIGLKNSGIIDSSAKNTSKLYVAKNNAALDNKNKGFIPVYENNKYIFTTVHLNGRSMFTAADEFVFSPVFENFVHEALYAGKKNSGIEIVVRLKWKRAGNYDGVQEFIYLDDMVQTVIDTYIVEKGDYAKAFTAKFSGKEAEGNPDMDVTAVVRSAAGVEIDTGSSIFDEENIVTSFGAISDIHIGDTARSEPQYRTAVATLRKMAMINDSDGLDAININGDLTQNGYLEQAEDFVSISKDLQIKNLMLTAGNHEYYNSQALLPWFVEQLGLQVTDCAVDLSMLEKGAYHAVVNGSHFIMMEPANFKLDIKPFDTEVISWVDNTLKNITTANPDAPVFVFTHIKLNDTNMIDVISKYPQVLMFNSHTHEPINVPTCINQSAYTEVNTGSVHYLGHAGSSTYANVANKVPDYHLVSTGHLVQVDINGNVRITRVFFEDETTVKERWEISHPTSDNSHLQKYTSARAARNTAPVFDSALQVSATTAATETGLSATVTLAFTAAQDNDSDDLIREYQVTYTNVATGEQQTQRLLSDYYRYGDRDKMATDLTFTVTLDAIVEGDYTVDVVAVDCWQTASNKISCNLTVK